MDETKREADSILDLMLEMFNVLADEIIDLAHHAWAEVGADYALDVGERLAKAHEQFADRIKEMEES